MSHLTQSQQARHDKCLISWPKSGRSWAWWAASWAIAHHFDIDPMPYRKRNRAMFAKDPLFTEAGLPLATSEHVGPDSGHPKIDLDLFLLVRDPRDTITSAFYWHEHNESFSSFVESEGRRMARWAHAWEQDHRTFSSVLAYEDFHNDFHAALATFLEWLEAPYTEADLAYAREQATFEHMKQYEPRKMRKGKTGDWQAHFGNADERRLADILATWPCSWWERYAI